jgi:ElaB/YqjD/DUF883 family membrane-anchored ribosome-binding protein
MSEEQLSLDRYFAAVWRAKWFIAAVTIVAAGLAAWLGFRQPTLHDAAALVEVGRVWKEPLEDTYTTTEIVNSPGFKHQLAAKIGVKPTVLIRGIKAETIRAGPRRAQYPILVRILATAESSDESVRLAQAVADELVSRHASLFDAAMQTRLERERHLEERIKDPALQSSPALRDLLVKLQSELDEVRSNNHSPTVTEKTHLIEQIVEGATTSPAPWRSIATAALLGALLSTLVAILFDHFKSISRPKAVGKPN